MPEDDQPTVQDQPMDPPAANEPKTAPARRHAKKAKPKRAAKKAAAQPAAKRKEGMDPWKIAAITLGALFIIIVIFRSMGTTAPSAPEQAAPPDQEAPQLADTSKDPEISLTVVNDKTCASCDTSQVLNVIKTQLFPSVKVKELDYASAQAKKLVKELDIQALPAYIFDAKVAEAANYGKVAPALLKKGERYVVHPAAVGAGKYLNPPSTDDDPMEGDADAPVTIIEFSDFQCPFCGKFFKETLPQLRKDYIETGKAKLVFRDFPLDFHQFAQKAAEAAECAHEQGKFWEMHDMIFDHQDALAVDDLKGYAKQAGLDTTKFGDCLDSGKYESEVKKDLADGSNVGVSGTPAFFINGMALTGAQPYEAFKQIIDAELAK